MSKEVPPFTKKELDKHKKDFGVKDKVYPRKPTWDGVSWQVRPISSA